jgi:multicomponent K+:H+ antiporter subunit A
MSIVAICGGVALYFLLRSYLLTCDGPPFVRHIKGQRIFDRTLVAISWRLSRSLESIFGTRRLQPQLQWLVCIALAAGLAPLYARGADSGGAVSTTLDLTFALMWSVGAACALAAAYQAKFHRLAALVLLGGAGLITSISFVWFSAPDLALTQLVVEAVTTVLLLLGLRWLPKRTELNAAGGPRWYRIRDFVIAVAAGSGMAALSYAIMTRPRGDSIAGYFVERAYTGGGGTNIVNVILVDFRAFDTLGEITVLCVVALTIYALLRRFRPAVESIRVPQQQHFQRQAEVNDPKLKPGDIVERAMAIPALAMTVLFPIIATVSIFLLLRGHDQPGGGFAAGITLAIAFITQYIARSTTWVESRLRILPMLWMGLGLMLASGVGVAAWLFDKPFLTSAFFYLDLPWIGAVPTASALLFDLGVFSIVVGATVLMLIALAHQSLRTHRAPERPLIPPAEKVS